MAGTPAHIKLTEAEETALREWCRKGTTEQRTVERARIILLSHEGLTVETIAKRLGTRPARVSKWRQRFAKDRLGALADAPRPGKPQKYTADTEKRVLALLDQPAPEGYGQWNGALLAAELKDVSPDQVWRILRRHGIQLQRRRSWCITTDPEFGPKAADVVGLYLNPPEKAVVLCIDEKPHIQALQRAQGFLRMPDGKAVNGFSHCYKRHGTTTLFAALDVAHRSGDNRALCPASKTRVSGFHERRGCRERRPGDSRHPRQPEHSQAETGSLAQNAPLRSPSFHSYIQFMAQSGGMLVQHSQPVRTAWCQFHFGPAAPRCD